MPAAKPTRRRCSTAKRRSVSAPQAARKLLGDTEKAILERLNAPCAYQPYPSVHQREHPYYRINIRHFSVFYVVIGDVMEVRRFLYSKRDLTQLL